MCSRSSSATRAVTAQPRILPQRAGLHCGMDMSCGAWHRVCGRSKGELNGVKHLTVQNTPPIPPLIM